MRVTKVVDDYIIIFKRSTENKYKTRSEMKINKTITNNCGISSYAFVPVIAASNDDDKK
jgi:hypothetical protein